MNNCKFCNTPIGGDIPEDHEFILDEDIDRDIKKSIRKDSFSIEYKETEYFNLWVDICNDQLVVCLSEEKEEEGKGIGVVKENPYHININYCPLCGRKMNSEQL